jgi:hypothetical protein
MGPPTGGGKNLEKSTLILEKASTKPSHPEPDQGLFGTGSAARASQTAFASGLLHMIAIPIGCKKITVRITTPSATFKFVGPAFKFGLRLARRLDPWRISFPISFSGCHMTTPE